MELFIGKAQGPAVQPHEIGGIRGVGLDLGDVFVAVVHHEVEVVGEIGQQLLQPLLAFVEGRLHGGEGEGVVAVDVHALPVVVIDLLHVGVGEHHGAGLETRQVEGLGAGDARHHVGGNLRGEGGGGDVFFAVEDEVGVDLVGDHQHVILQAQLHHPAQVRFLPDDAQGVVGRAEHEEIHLLELFFKVRPVHGPLTVHLHTGVLHHLAVPGLRHIVELRVHGGLDQNAAPLRGEELHARREGLDHAQAPAHEAGVDVPAVAALLPVPNGLKIAGGPGGVAPDALLGPGREGVDDGLGGLEVHVRDPQGDHIVGAEFFLALVVLGGVVVGTVDDLVKIVCHSASSFLPVVFGMF